MENYRKNLLEELKENKDFLPPFSGDPLGWYESKLFFYNLYNINKENGDNILNLLREKALGIIENNIANNHTSNINKLTHKVWLTSIENPSIPNEEILKSLKSHYQELSDYKHYFWTNNLDIANKIINLLEINNIYITIKNINLFNDMPSKKYVDFFLKNKLYANAGDILRIMIVYKYGGIYSDMGFSLKKYISYLLNDFDIMFNGEDAEWCKGYISHNVIYAKEPKNLIFESMLSNLTNKKIIYEIAQLIPIVNLIIEMVSPRFIMVFIPSHYSNKKFISLKNNSFTFDRYQTNSHSNGSFGSSILETKLKEEKFQKDMKNIVDNLN
jgi:mannosyltransferase OCH1-like enzyme